MNYNEFTCDICNAPMELDKRFSNHKQYRRRRFKCTICDYKKLIFADGFGDEKGIPHQGIEIINKNFKQEEENRNV